MLQRRKGRSASFAHRGETIAGWHNGEALSGRGSGGVETVRVWLLGGFRVSVGSRTIEVSGWRLKKAGALVKLLALAPGYRLHREQIMAALWPELDAKPAVNNLHRALHFARSYFLHEQTHTYADRGAYTVTVTITEGDPNPASDSATFQITVGQPGDTTPPTILSVNPRESQKGVPRTTDITITFSEEMDTASLNADTVRLVKAGSITPKAVTRETSTDASGRTVLTLDPITPKLAKSTAYKVTVEGTDPPGDVFAVKDLSNNELANDKVWSFKTKRR
jgi:hypothetical protein